MRGLVLSAAFGFLLAAQAQAQQVADTQADLSVAHPAFTTRHPHVVIDGAHNNFHTVDGRYAPVAQILRNDGMQVDGSTAPFTAASLRGIDVLIIANPLAAVNAPDNWKLPTPSAFTPEEIAAVHRWVEHGGSLFLIADHMPFAGAAHDLGAAFGVTFENGFALRTLPGQPSTSDMFSRENNGLVDDPLIANVHQVRTFTGSAFAANGPHVRPILRLSADYTIYNTVTAWEFLPDTPQLSGADHLQGALIELGRGRVAVFGEAAMFSAQISGQARAGVNAPGAEENKQFELDLVNWLAHAD